MVLVTFPAVAVGSILEWEYEVRFHDLRYFQWWEVQESIPVLDAGFEIRFHRFPEVDFDVSNSLGRVQLTVEELPGRLRLTREVQVTSLRIAPDQRARGMELRTALP